MHGMFWNWIKSCMDILENLEVCLDVSKITIWEDYGIMHITIPTFFFWVKRYMGVERNSMAQGQYGIIYLSSVWVAPVFLTK